MAFNDTLFQLGMDLTRSSTTQKEEFGSSTSVDRSVRKESSESSGGIRFAGTHLSIDLLGARRIDDVGFVEMALRKCVAADGAHALHIHLSKPTSDQGVSGMILIGDIHISIRSTLENGYVALDVFTQSTELPSGLAEALRHAFVADKVVARELSRGTDDAKLVWKPVTRKVPRLARSQKARVAA